MKKITILFIIFFLSIRIVFAVDINNNATDDHKSKENSSELVLAEQAKSAILLVGNPTTLGGDKL